MGAELRSGSGRGDGAGIETGIARGRRRETDGCAARRALARSGAAKVVVCSFGCGGESIMMMACPAWFRDPSMWLPFG